MWPETPGPSALNKNDGAPPPLIVNRAIDRVQLNGKATRATPAATGCDCAA